MKIKKAAKKIEKMGQKGDTILAHINEEEAGLLKAMGGSGKRHPKTGLLQFNEDGPGGSDTGSERNGDYGGGMGNEVGDLSRGAVDAWGGPNAGMSLQEQYGEYGRGRQLAEQAAGYGFGATNNALGTYADQYQTMNPVQRALLGGLGALGAYLGGNTSLGTNTNGARGISQSDPFSANFAGTGSRGNGFDGGNLPNDNATTPTAPTTPGTGTAPGLPITPPNWGNYGPSPFTYKFGQPRNMSGLLNFGG